MNLQTYAAESEFPFPGLEALSPTALSEQAVLAADLRAALAREQALIRKIVDLESRRELQIRELNHRLFNGLQSIASLLSAQSRQATPEAAAQLSIAISRIVAFGQVNRRLHLLDHQDRVEFSEYLAHLCADLSALLLWQQPGCAIAIEAIPLELPTATAIPLSFIINELITNSVKYAAGKITIRLEALSPNNYSLSVSDQGPGLPAGFDLAGKKGLGMRIVQSLVQQIAGELLISAGQDSRGVCFAVHFTLPVGRGVA
ncbi:MAG: sensor histidine kinase [Rhodopseudomonas sp.]|uniref:sensor histidine kinase n=1 Tax=Rhodopseudomonas sp. TaxID=1078 RepID=UPI0017EF16BE|nr:sensor histidine kinase [Rhodopseudomonas sp.]NVN85678.1 sensor histidine kinase [Rhodopseudomonas sp.]